ncbi:MAG: CPBP family intramembrane metalloprotease [Phycisphaerae bacterium]|nr:CPBP family intramembrane metalloprotease [Phycisphaerae bacterium]
MKSVLRVLLAFCLFACVYALALFGMPSLARLAGLFKACPWLLGTSLVPQLTFLITSIILAYVLGRGDLSTYGWKSVKPRQLLRPIIVSTITMLIFMSPMLIMMIAGRDMPDEGMKLQGPWSEGLFHKILFIWIIASICEEVFYRGLLQGVLEPLTKHGVRVLRVRFTAPVALCAIAFGLGHLCLLGMVPTPMLVGILLSATMLGFIAGYYREKTGSLAPAIAAHMTFNVIGTMIPLLACSLHG